MIEDEAITRQFEIFTNQKLNLGDIVYILDEKTGKEQQIVFTNGCKILTGPFLP